LVLDDVGLTVHHKEIVAIIGQSGGGKTTLLRCVNLLERPDRATMEVAGEVIFSGDRALCRDLAKLRQSVGMVFQRFNLFPHLTAVENIMLAQVRAGVSEDEALDRAVRLLRRVGLAHRGVAYPEQLSGGEQQRVAIARALVGDPRVVLADEPTGNLDTRNGHEVIDLLDRLNAERGVAIVLVTHEPDVAARARRQIHIRDGLIERDTTTSPTAVASPARPSSPGRPSSSGRPSSPAPRPDGDRP
jgi:ABC-type lipoprotein export system ATPase subunit